MTLTLFYTPNTCSPASHLALEHAGAEYQLRRVDFSKAEQRSPEFLRINPKARVPALVTRQGIENELLRGPWVMGDAYGICNLYLFTIAQWLESDGVDAARFPKVSAHRQRMRDNPLVQRVLGAESQAA